MKVLVDRANLENRGVGDRALVFHGGHSKLKNIGLALENQSDSHAWDLIFLHHGLNGFGLPQSFSARKF